jgi:Ca-activated chloride channel family protein
MNRAVAVAITSLVAIAAGLGGCVQKNADPTRSSGGFSGGSTHLRAAMTLPMAGHAARPPAPPGGLPALDEEVWVIVRSDSGDASAMGGGDLPGCGGMIAVSPGQVGGAEVPLPLQHTDVQASISAYIASVEVTQQFVNPFDGTIEAVYVFPLPQDAAITGFVMTVGERRIRGIVRERQEAEQIYQEARRQGHVASLLTQERPNVFTQKVANIEPGRRIDVSITYFHTLTYDDGWYEFVFPMVVGPRFNPPGHTDGVGAVSRGQSGRSGQGTEVQYLAPGERSGHDVALAVEIDAAVSIEQLESPSHRIDVWRPEPELAQVRLQVDDTIPNRDFVLRYRIAGDRVRTALLTHRDTRGGYFAFMLYPPQDPTEAQRRPMEMIFVLDCSGSMHGRPIEQARRAVNHALDRLGPDDSFQIVRFSAGASQLGPAPLPATAANIRKGRKYLRSLEAGGGTMMLEGLRASLDFPHDEDRLRVVTFLTDGFIGNEAEVLGEVHDRVGAARIFSFGVGSAPNRYLLSRMAKLGRGAVAYLGLDDDGGEVMDRYLDRVTRPVLTDVALDWGTMQVRDVVPARIPDLFVGRPVIVTGRFDGRAPAAIGVRGRVGGYVVESRVSVDPGDGQRHDVLSAVWARGSIAQLMDLATYRADVELPDRIRALALAHGLVSAYTAFVAVDASTTTTAPHGTTIPVAVPVPEGVRYETTVQR